MIESSTLNKIEQKVEVGIICNIAYIEQPGYVHFIMDDYELKSELTAYCALSSLQTTNTAGKLYNHSFVRVLAELAEFFSGG